MLKIVNEDDIVISLVLEHIENYLTFCRVGLVVARGVV
jgi:hypothetical protein